MKINLEFLKQLVESWGYVMVFLGVGLESTGIPFPGETILLVAAAIAASSNRLHIEWVIIWAALGAIAGDSLGYWAGRELGRHLLNKVAPLVHFNARKQARVENFFRRHGAKTVFIGRFIAFLRTWTAFFAGMNRMHYPQFLKYNALGGTAWAFLVGLVGFLFGQNLSLVEKWLGDFSLIAFGLILACLVGYYFFRKRNKVKEELD